MASHCFQDEGGLLFSLLAALSSSIPHTLQALWASGLLPVLFLLPGWFLLALVTLLSPIHPEISGSGKTYLTKLRQSRILNSIYSLNSPLPCHLRTFWALGCGPLWGPLFCLFITGYQFIWGRAHRSNLSRVSSISGSWAIFVFMSMSFNLLPALTQDYV